MDININKTCEDWMKVKSLSIKSSTITKYENILRNHIIPFFNYYGIENLSNNVVVDYIHHLYVDKQLSTSQIKTIKYVLRSFYNYLSNIYKLNQIDFDQIKLNTPLTRSKTLTKYQKDCLLRHCQLNRDSDSIAIMLGLYAGLRIGEICGLMWDDIDFDDKTIKINRTIQRTNQHDGDYKTKLTISTPKTRHSYRLVVMTPFLFDYLYEFYLKMGIKNNHVYLLSCNQQIIEPRRIQRKFKKICRLYGFDTNFHTLRHTFATNCIHDGVDVKTVSEMLGHSNVSITLNRYVHSSLEYKKQEMNKLKI